jgi:phosphoglycerate dehydrogenase-like enzyme
LVTPTTFGKNDLRLRSELEAAVGEVIYNELGRPLTSEEVLYHLPGVDGYIAGVDEVDSDALAGADRLKVIARYGVGVDRVDLEAAARKSIVVTNTPQANSVSVAELAVGLLVALARSIPQKSSEVRHGAWPRTRGLTLAGKTVGLLGFGSIGKEVARRLRGWGCRVIGYDPKPDHAAAKELEVELTGFNEVVAESDFLSLHLPVLPETRGMVNTGFLTRMKQGAFLVNTARGELVDEAALAAGLECGHLSGAALDTLNKEPPSPQDRLCRLPEVIITPHCGAHTDSSMDAMGWGSLRDCLAVLRGEEPAHPVA